MSRRNPAPSRSRWVELVYDGLFLFGGILSLPWWIWQRYGKKKYRGVLLQKWGIRLPPPLPKKEGSFTIWVHAVSVGEVKALQPLLLLLREKHPEAQIVGSTTTTTGLAQAFREFDDWSALFLVPWDFRWVMRSLVRRLKPNLLLLVEGDFWFHLIGETYRSGAEIAIVNGKLSERSLQRWERFPWLGKALFAPVQVICVQELIYEERWRRLGVPGERLYTTGNMKCDRRSEPPSSRALVAARVRLGILPEHRCLALVSTHSGEEKLLLEALQPLLQSHPQLRLFVAPRHPERFAEVSAWTTACWSRGAEPTDRVVLIDAMGVLGEIYPLSLYAVVGGSFVPGIGGHNVWEPLEVGVPPLFGPYTEAQRALVQRVTSAGAGAPLNLDRLTDEFQEYLNQPGRRLAMQQRGALLLQEGTGAVASTSAALGPLLSKIQKG